MDNLKFTLFDTPKFEELICKLNQIYELLQSDRPPSSKLYSTEEACQYLKVCSKTLQNYRDTGQVKFTQNGRKILYSQHELNEFLEKNKKEIFVKALINI